MHRRIGGEDVLVADRRTCLKLIAAAIVVPSALGRSSSDVCLTERQESRTGSLDYKIRLDTIRKGFDQDFPAHDYCWVHPRAGVIPGEKPVVMVTMQKTHVKQARETAVGDDVYYAVNELRSEDMGRSWLGPVEHPTLGRREGADSISMVISGFMPQWHARTRKLLGTGSVLRYSGKTYLGYLQRKVPRETGYAVYDAWSRAWSGWTVMEVPDRAKFYHEGADSCQRVDLPDGEILLPTYFADTRIAPTDIPPRPSPAPGRGPRETAHKAQPSRKESAYDPEPAEWPWRAGPPEPELAPWHLPGSAEAAAAR